MIKALLVDDNEAKRYVIRRALSMLCVDVVESESLDAAVGAIKETTFDAAIIDYKLGNADGFQLAAALRAATNALPIMMISTYVPTLAAQQHAGLIDVFVNELNPDVINRQVRRLLKIEHILIVDDDLDTLDALAMGFSLRGLAIQAAESRDAALGMLALDKPRLVLTDWMMKGASLETFVKEARRLHPDLRLVLMSAAHENAFAEAARLGMNGAIEKPFLIEEFCRKFLP